MKINNLKTYPSTGKTDDSFIGIRIKNNKIEFHYPETYVLAENNDDLLRKDILSILRTISLAKTTTHDLSSYNSEHTAGNVFPLSSYLWIINDYLTYGKYVNKEKVYENNCKGKINWKRTLRSNPAISYGKVIYTEIVSEHKNQKDNLLTEIYNCCVKFAIDNIGWLYGLTYDSNGVNYNKLLESKKNLYVSTLNTEITHTFEDTKKTRLQNMKNIIIGLDDKMVETNEVIYGVDSYEYVFEKMIDNLFSNIKNKDEFYPNAKWDLIYNGQKKSSNLRPDTVLIKDKKVYILDAKYYRYGVTFDTHDVPDTTSIQKQITYGEYVKKVREGVYDDVYSAFVMPYSMTKNIKSKECNKVMEFVGIATAQWMDSSISNSRKIAAILIDTNYLINNWVRKNDDKINEIVELIENSVRGYKQ